MKRIYYFEAIKEKDNIIYYDFKAYVCGTLILSQEKIYQSEVKWVRGGNKKKSKEINILRVFMNSIIYHMTEKPYRTPDLTLWNNYFNSFWVSEKIFMEWLDDQKLTNQHYTELRERLKIKIKDNNNS